MAVANEGELAALTQQGLSRRTVASTCMNAGSSRSHCLITLTVQRHLPDGAVMHGKLTLVDLAGLKIGAIPDTTIFCRLQTFAILQISTLIKQREAAMYVNDGRAICSVPASFEQHTVPCRF